MLLQPYDYPMTKVIAAVPATASCKKEDLLRMITELDQHINDKAAATNSMHVELPKNLLQTI
jgi:hypothetical protein